jgi:hypothetical protein
VNATSLQDKVKEMPTTNLNPVRQIGDNPAPAFRGLFEMDMLFLGQPPQYNSDGKCLVYELELISVLASNVSHVNVPPAVSLLAKRVSNEVFFQRPTSIG